jgi:hypothetical protein
MADENDGQKISVSVPIGAIAVGLAIALGTAYMLTNREEETSGGAVKDKLKSGKGFGRKMGLMTLITLIENDATRRVVVGILRAMAKRA